MKKKLFRSLGNLLGNKKVVLPFLGLLAASALLVWTTAFAPQSTSAEESASGTKEGEKPSSREKKPEEGKTSSAESRKTGFNTSSENPKQCRAITKKGTRCQHMADESGYCPQHRALFEQVPAESSQKI